MKKGTQAKDWGSQLLSLGDGGQDETQLDVASQP